MSASIRYLVLLAMGWGAMALAAAGNEPFLRPSDPSSPPVVSITQQFVFRGFDRRDGTRLAAWMDDVSARLAGRLGRPIPFARFEMVRIEGATVRDPAGGEIYVGQSLVEGALQQRVVVANPEAVEEEALLEAMTQVLLNRCVLRMRSSTGPLPAASLVPDWFSVGMAHTLRADFRRRDGEFIAEQWRGGAAMKATSVLELQRLPAGRTTDKAYCGALVTWMEERTLGPDRWTPVLRRFAEGKPVNPAWLAREAPGASTEREVDIAWDLWLAKTARPALALGEVDFDQVKVLKNLLEIRLIDYGLAPSDSLPARLTPRDLLAYRDEQWAQAIALRLAAALREQSVGRAPEWTRVADAYARYLDGLQRGRKGAPGMTVLRGRVETAEEELGRLEKAVAMQSYVVRTAASREQPAEAPGSGRAEPAEQDPSLDALRKRFLDSLDAPKPRE